MITRLLLMIPLMLACGASALEAQADTIVAMKALGDHADVTVEAAMTPHLESCRQLPKEIEIKACMAEVAGQWTPVLSVLDAYHDAFTAWAAGLIAAESGDAVDVIALGTAAWDAYRSLVRVLRDVGLEVEPIASQYTPVDLGPLAPDGLRYASEQTTGDVLWARRHAVGLT